MPNVVVRNGFYRRRIPFLAKIPPNLSKMIHESSTILQREYEKNRHVTGVRGAHQNADGDEEIPLIGARQLEAFNNYGGDGKEKPAEEHGHHYGG